MTQQEMETIIQELETTFNQKAVEKTWEPSSSGFDFDRYTHTWANDRTRQFETYYGVALWAGNVLVTTITKVNQWEAFKSVARLFNQVEKPDATYFLDGIDGGMHTGMCIHCDRLGLLNSFDACEGCVRQAQI